MKFRLFWIIFIGVALALLLLFIVQLISFAGRTPVSAITSSDSAAETESKPNNVDTGLSPVFFRTISEYGAGEFKKLRINGTSEPDNLSLIHI